MSRINIVHYSSKKMDWRTPQSLFDALNDEFNFTLDVAATRENSKCPNYYTQKEDALTQPWNGTIFCNPPYGRTLGLWVQKAYNEYKKGSTVVMLIPARTDTSYFHDYIYGKAEIRFLRGRVKFIGDDGMQASSAPFPSMVVIFNNRK